MVWIMVEKGFVKPDGEYEKWNKDDVAKSNLNNRGLSTIFNLVSPTEFHHITNCETSKEAWDILEKSHEGTKGVQKYKLQMLTSRFEMIT